MRCPKAQENSSLLLSDQYSLLFSLYKEVLQIYL